jgi:transglutaminase-like putative cysteine protease
MPRLLLLLLAALAACSDREAAKAPGPPVAVAPPAPAVEAPAAPKSDRIALRAYERLIENKRAATMRVEWRAVERDGRKLVEDVTETRSRSVRMMAGVPDVFHEEHVSRTLRTEDGELISQESVSTKPGRIDKEKVERTPAGYRVVATAGPNVETFEIPAATPAMVDAEAFLAPKVRSGEAKAGAIFALPLLDTQRRRMAEATLKVIGPDDEGPGLKVIESLEGNDTLWWFAEDGSVVRLRAGITVIRRDDAVGLDDLPARPASWRITLPSDVDLPRIFTTKSMLVDIVVQTDETTKPPQVPPSPFTETIERAEDRVRVLLRSHDDPAATCPLPIDPKGFEEHLKATRLMEVDDRDVRRLAREILGDAKDAREGARRIAEFVFSTLRKGSPEIDQPTMKEILRQRLGDCSEHALLFTGLCRAAGIPARRCSGWVCVGDDWGGHGWCEIWVGRWIGADPTTNEIGTRARYIMFSRPDEPDVPPGFLTAERTKILIRRAEYSDGVIDFDGTAPDLEVFSGIRLGEVPEGWKVTRDLRSAWVQGPDFLVAASLHADHGYRSMELLIDQLPDGIEGEFGGRTAAVSRALQRWRVPLGREILDVSARAMNRGGSIPPADTLAKLFAPTLERAD